MFFTQEGRCYVEKVYEIPEMGRASKGRSHRQFPRTQAGRENRRHHPHPGQERPTRRPGRPICTWSSPPARGIVKKSNLSDFKNIRKGGIIAIKIEEGDRLINAKLTSGIDEIVLITRDGMSLRFSEEELRDQGRDTVGVWGIRPEEGDLVVDMAIVNADATLLVAGENGIGKRTPFDDYRKQTRGGKGIITMKTGDKTGQVVGALAVRDADELMLITNKGQMVRTPRQRNPRDRRATPWASSSSACAPEKSSRASPPWSARKRKRSRARARASPPAKSPWHRVMLDGLFIANSERKLAQYSNVNNVFTVRWRLA